MVRDLSQLDQYLASEEIDGYLLRASGADANQRYLSGFGAPDAFATLYTKGETHLLVRNLERALARKESRANSVAGHSDFGGKELAAEYGPTRAEYRVLKRFVGEHAVESVAVPSSFPIGIADGLRELSVVVTPDHDQVIDSIRSIKTAPEIESIVAVQRATERAMHRVEEMLQSASIDGDRLFHNSAPLTSECVKEEIDITLLREGCLAQESIVACGSDGAEPHNRGAGSLRPHEPIVVDIFPYDRTSKYFADMTRTFCVGEPTDTAQQWFDLTKEAQAIALDMLGPGVTGEEVHGAVCEVYENAGIPTLRTDEGTETGFIHSTGHGLGLELHEAPRLGTGAGELKPGHVVTVEPGVYDPEVGGFRIEDLVVITEDGIDNLTDYHRSFIL